MKIALCHFRVGETDGVSLEMEKWKKVLKHAGHEVFLVAGSTGTATGATIPELFYKNKENLKFNTNAYNKLTDFSSEKEFEASILEYAKKLEINLIEYIRQNEIDMLIPNNIWSLGWNLPAAIGVYNAVKKLKIKCIAHHHDFYWERKEYSHPTCKFIKDILNKYMPPSDKLIKHAVINSIAQKELKNKRNIEANVIPNVFGFNSPPWGVDSYNRNFRKEIGVHDNDIVILQATRITERKAIELAIDLVGKLTEEKNLKKLHKHKLYDKRVFTKKDKIVLVLAGLPEAKSGYTTKLKNRAAKKNVNLLFVNDIIEEARCKLKGKKCYSLWDAYVHADLVTYPSIIEGWGNQFLEAVFAKKPIVVFEYPVYKTDIKDSGFHTISLGDSYTYRKNGLIKIDENILEFAADLALKTLIDQKKTNKNIQDNFMIGKEYYSHETLENLLSGIVSSFDITNK